MKAATVFSVTLCIGATLLPPSAQAQSGKSPYNADVLELTAPVLDRLIGMMDEFRSIEARTEAAQPALLKCDEKVEAENHAKVEAWYDKFSDSEAVDSIAVMVKKRCGGYPGEGSGVYYDDPEFITKHGFTERQFYIIKERIIAYFGLKSDNASPVLAALNKMGRHYVFSAVELKDMDTRRAKLTVVFDIERK